MSVKHVKEYYNKISAQYLEMQELIKEMETECTNSMKSPEFLENLKISIKPIKEQYNNLSYIMYLLNQPNRKEKQKRYIQQNKNILKNIDEKYKQDSVISNGEKILKNLSDSN